MEFYYPLVIRVTEQCKVYFHFCNFLFSSRVSIMELRWYLQLHNPSIHLCVSMKGQLELIPACILPEAATFTQISNFFRNLERSWNFLPTHKIRIFFLKADSASHLATCGPPNERNTLVTDLCCLCPSHLHSVRDCDLTCHSWQASGLFSLHSAECPHT